MVFESVVTDVLNKILGDYVENLDKTQLKIGIWGGDVVLHNLKLRENALDEFDLPVQLVYGYLGKLVLKIPWKNLYSQPVVAEIEDLYLLVSPKQSVPYDAEKEEKYELQAKQSALQLLEEGYAKESEKDNPKPDASFTEKLTAQIVNNLQLKIANVHARYEDTTTTGSPFAFGATMHDLEIYTTDVNWVKCYLTEQVSRVYKIANLDSLSVYMNCNADQLFASCCQEDLSDLFRSNIARKELLPAKYNYIIGPISSFAKLQLNLNPEYDDPPFVIPKIDLCLEMEKLNVGLTSTQFQDILKLADSMNRMQLGAPYRKYRPFNMPYKNNYKVWWKFAITAVLEVDVRRNYRCWTWEYIAEHRKLCKTYAEKQKERELCKKPTANLLETCNLIEKKLDLFNLVMIRKRVHLEVEKIRSVSNAQKEPQKTGWFGGWFGGAGKKDEAENTGNIAKKIEAAMTAEEKKKLYAAIGYQENTVQHDVPEYYEAIKLYFKLVALEIGLYDDSSERAKSIDTANSSHGWDRLQTIMQLKFSMATCSLQQRPAANGLSVTAGMKEMELIGIKRNDYTPTIIASKITDEFNLLDIFFELNPLDKCCDQRIKVHARPLQFIYDSDTILHLLKVFTPSTQVNLSELEGAATARMANFKERSATGMQYIIEQHSLIEVDIKFMPNILIMPRTGTYHPGDDLNSLIVVSLGELHISSEPHNSKLSADITELHALGQDRTQIMQSILKKAYDKYEINIKDMQILVAKPHEQWEAVLETAAYSELHVLRPTTLNIKVDLCVVDDDPRLPKTKVEILLPSIHINITEDRIFEALDVLISIPLPESDTPEALPLKRAMSSASSILSVTNFLNQEKKKVRSTKSKTQTELGEITQYTSLELDFALKELSVTLYKSNSKTTVVSAADTPTDSTHFGTPIEEMPNGSIEEFKDTQSHVAFVTETLPHKQKLMSLQILQLEANVAQRTYELVATAKLGAINLTQHDNFAQQEEIHSIIDTPRFSEELEYLLTVNYTMVNKISPEFTTKYNSTEQLIAVNFSTLNVLLHQECLLYLLEFAALLQNKLDDVTKGLNKEKDRVATADVDNVISKLTTITEEVDEEETEISADRPQVSHRSRHHNKVVESIKISVVANLEQVGVMIACRKRCVASLKVKSFYAGVIIKSSYTEVNMRLKDIIVTDLNVRSIHTSILSIVGNNALNCQVVLYNVSETANYNSDDMKITVEIGCMKIVFLNWFVTSVLNFLNNFQAALSAVAIAGAAAADNAMVAYEKATRMKLNIKIKAPIIVVPVDSQSLNAIVLDLGFLMLTNTMSEVNVLTDERSPAIIDEIKLDLRDVKISKVTILPGHDNEDITVLAAMDTVDTAYGLQSTVNILDPISFTLTVKRNLSAAWYLDVPEIDVSGGLQTVELNLFREDYGLIMSILNRNLNEGADELSPTVEHVTTQQSKNKIVESRSTTKAEVSPQNRSIPAKLTKSKQNIHEQIKFNFKFDGIIVNLMLDELIGLSRFGLYFISVKGNKLIDGTLSTSVVLCNIQIEDTRENMRSKITKYLSPKGWNMQKQKSCPDEIIDTDDRNFMLDVTAIIKENDTFAEVRVSAFDLILSIDFLLKLADFFALPEEAEPIRISEISVQESKLGPAQPSKPTIVVKQTESKMNLWLHIDEPDIILVESLDDINTNAIIFNAQARLNYRVVGEKQMIHGQIDALKMYMCSFVPEKRESTKHYIIHPCVISLQGSTPEGEGLHLSLKLSEIIINVSPATIELFNKAMQTISASSAEKAAVQKKEADYSEIWQKRKFKDKEHWFVKVDQAEDAFELLNEEEIVLPDMIKTERCIVEVPSITIVIEIGVGYYTTPLIAFDTRLNALISDWSRSLSIKGSLSLSMNYFNQALAVWEPIIEQNEHISRNGEKNYLPWELNFGLAIETQKSEFDEDVEENTTKISIHSEENLELTMSKTCLELMGTLGEAFSLAIAPQGLVKPEVIAPYVLENDTGFDVTLYFERGIFALHECHLSRDESKNFDNSAVNWVFKVETKGAVFKPEEVKECKISPGGRVFLQTKDLSTMTSEEDEEYNIYIKIGDIDKEVILPVSKSDKRFFPLYRDTNQDPWGIVSEVYSKYGTTKINIHGVLSVHNHFTTPIQIYRHNKSYTSTEMVLHPSRRSSIPKVFVGEVAPGKLFHVPLHAIYCDTKDLFFAISGYNISVQGIRWNDSPNDLAYSRQLQCDPIETFEPLYMSTLRIKTEVFHENTNKFKLLSAFYTIHVRPPLYMRNSLPISIKVSVAGCSVRHVNATETAEEEKEEEEDVVTEYARPSLIKEDLLDYGEKEVEPGDILHLPTVKLSGRSKESRSYLVVRLIQYLEKDWSCTTEISEDHENVVTWTFSSYDSVAKMDMDLCARFDDRDGSIMVTLYSPIWMINKTGLMLSYQTQSETLNVLYHPPEYNGPILFSFREKYFFDNKNATIRVDNGEWSEKIPLDVAGSIGAVKCMANDMIYQIGVHNSLTQNSLTKQITFIPFYIAINKCEFEIELQEQSRPGDPWIRVVADACVPLWPKNNSNHLCVIRMQNECTLPFNYSEVQCTLLQLDNNKYGGINVDVQTTEGGVYITFTAYSPGDAPGLIINHTSQPVTFYEKGSNIERSLQSHEKVLYTWLDPAGERRIVVGKNKVESDLRRDGVGELILPNGTSAFWVSFLDGLQRILLLTQIEAIATKTESSSTLHSVAQSIEVRIHGIGLSVVNNETGVDILYLGIASSGVIWESKKPDKKRFKQMNIHDTSQLESNYQTYVLDKSVNEVKTYNLDGKHPIDFERMLLHKSSVRMIQRTFYPGVWISMNTSPYQTQLHAKINKIQLDNQLTDCIFPVVLASIPPPKSVATVTTLKPFVECSIVQRVVPNSTVKQFKYASMLIQEFHVKVDILFLTAIAELFTGAVNDEQAAKLFLENVQSIEKPLSDTLATHSMLEQKHFYDNLHLGPLKIHVSFSMAGSDTTALPGILSTLVQGVGVTLTDANDVVFRLAFFEREFQFFTQRQLTSEITSHYMGQALKQLYVLVLGLDVLGNPYGLVVGLKKGVEDLFYEPFQGAIQGPGEFAEGLVLGVKSLFGHTVGGAAGAVSKITGAVGKGLAALTFDDDYQKKRRSALHAKPANFQEGIARSSKGLVMGFVDGVTGVVTKPVSGAREEGVEGFFKGLGKGAIGLVARPTAGVVDFASGSFGAVKRATEASQDAKRLRPPRFLHPDNVLRPYCIADANGNKLLKEIEKGKYAGTDAFVHCEEVVQKKEFVLVSNHRVIYISKNEMFGTWTVQWTYLWDAIDKISSTDRGVEITLKKNGKKVLGLFSSQEAQRKVILIPHRVVRDQLAQIMESQCVKT